jgi:hypothetical protein
MSLNVALTVVATLASSTTEDLLDTSLPGTNFNYMPFKRADAVPIKPIRMKAHRRRRQFQPGGGGGPPQDSNTISGPVSGVYPAALLGQIGTANDGQLIYGPFEAGFGAGQFCTGQEAVPGGMDTLAALGFVNRACNSDSGYPFSILDACGGHAQPYHYHEHMTCL